MFKKLRSTDVANLRPEDTQQHVVALDDYVLHTPSSNEQVREIFTEHLPKFVAEQQKIWPDAKVPVVFWAHGGLVPREQAWMSALDAIPWWRENGIYPIYFVWDTGLVATMADLIEHWKAKFVEAKLRWRDIDVNVGADLGTTPWDRVLDEVARRAGGADVWRQMKVDAAKSNTETNGGGRIVVENLAAADQGLLDKISVHAVGHSAGAIFHAYFLDALINHQNGGGGTLQPESLQLLAPAISIATFIDLFKDTGENIDFTMYSMKEDAERRDWVVWHYRDGSLLYLIRDALEPEKDQAILGLQQCFDEAKVSLEQFFDDNDLVWSPTPDSAPDGSRSQAITHGGYPRDIQTMNSVARRILGPDRTITPY